MRVGVLGPLEVRTDAGDLVEVAGSRLRTRLARLALDPGRVVSTAQLVDAVWSDDPPAGAVNALQALVSRLRRAGLAVESHAAGYRLTVAPDEVDAERFERLAAAGRAEEALALWRGRPWPSSPGTTSPGGRRPAWRSAICPQWRLLPAGSRWPSWRRCRGPIRPGNA